MDSFPNKVVLVTNGRELVYKIASELEGADQDTLRKAYTLLLNSKMRTLLGLHIATLEDDAMLQACEILGVVVPANPGLTPVNDLSKLSVIGKKAEYVKKDEWVKDEAPLTQEKKKGNKKWNPGKGCYTYTDYVDHKEEVDNILLGSFSSKEHYKKIWPSI